MIVVRLTGGLGNQLFQFALGHGLAVRTGNELVLDKSQFQSSGIRRRGYPPHHQDYLKDLGFSYSSITNVIGVFREYSLQALRGRTALKWKVVRPPDTPSFLLEAAQSRNLFLTGYWQSPEYVTAYAGDLRALLMSRLTISDDYEDYIRFIGTHDVTSVHMRFGDYITVASNKKKYHHIDKKQLTGAIQDLRQRQAAVSLLIFSDDIDQARSYFKAEDDVHFVEVANSDPISELALMASCRHHIISNSTFSWWAAYLSDSKDSLVYCPKQWRRDMEFELCLPGWKRY